jgi:hypothetical protein
MPGEQGLSNLYSPSSGGAFLFRVSINTGLRRWIQAQRRLGLKVGHPHLPLHIRRQR